MKKTISLLGLALVAATNVALASNVETTNSQAIEIVNYDATPLCVAISKGDVTTVKKFIEYGANVNERNNGMTPLMFAARYNNAEIAKILLDNGADLNAKDNNNKTALQHAEAGKAEKVIEVLNQYKKK
ncbi:ankyrin repeat domain-containing protein [Flavobacterium sp.]|uniref:ankyrin repeat domain-containing protein n=1 Tax=Flavobacterium sp. TaxID=239 RepID=UPI0028BF0EA8|nr:ankyrin repeat domain-containing protein [Flavobacterium sp.]